MAGHTPGPWPQPTRSGDGKFISIEKWGPDRDNWHRLAVEVDSDDCDSDTAMANARLIAAAPELLDTLVNLCRCCDMPTAMLDLPTGRTQLADAIARARAAIARATGPRSHPRGDLL